MVSYLYIGTQKGLGDVIIYIAVGMIILVASGYKSKHKKAIKLFAILLIFSMFSYMVFNQGLRAIQLG